MSNFLIIAGYLSFRNLSVLETKKFNDLFDAIDAYEQKNKVLLLKTDQHDQPIVYLPDNMGLS